MLAAKNPALVLAVEGLYRELDEEIARLPRRCEGRTACCRFGPGDEVRLYVTAIEVCYYLSRRSPWPAAGGVCPHLTDGLCGVRDARPLGCRVYFCDASSQGWQGPMTEAYLSRLREMHAAFGVPYFYADWLVVLAALRGFGVSECAPIANTTSVPLRVMSPS